VEVATGVDVGATVENDGAGSFRSTNAVRAPVNATKQVPPTTITARTIAMMRPLEGARRDAPAVPDECRGGAAAGWTAPTDLRAGVSSVIDGAA
jgi:hypothetical protein